MSDFIKWVQMRLTSHGFPCGLIDGEDGPLTRAALMAFERSRDLPADGRADEAVVAELRKSSSAKGKIDEDRDTDWDVDPIKNVWPRQRDVERYYGKVGTNQGRIVLPFPMKLAWDLSKRVTRMTLHEKVCDSAARCFDRIADHYDEDARASLGLDLFGGSLNVRKMRGGSRYSMHSWGIAIDFDPARNRLKWKRDKARLARSDAEMFWRIWEQEGWVSLGRVRNFDWMHVQAARL